MLLHLDQRRIVPSEPVADDPEALIREARRRARRRRARWAVAAAVLVGLAAAVYAVVGGGSIGVVAETPTHPFANLRAFRGEGDLAFISRGQAWVLDGSRETLHQLPVPTGSAPSSPVFSHDGRWVAYLATPSQNAYGPSQLWIARADGTHARRVSGLGVNGFVGWSPSADLVAVGAGESTHAPVGSPTRLDLVSPGGRIRTLSTQAAREPATVREGIWSVVWSPDGRSLAVSTYSPAQNAGTQILDVPVATRSQPTVWLSIRNRQRLPAALSCRAGCGAGDAIAQLAGWWPGRGIGFWVFSSGMTHNSDETPLAVIAKPHAAPRLVAQTLSDGTTDAVDAGPDGQLAVVASSSSSGRDYAAGKTVQQCPPDRRGCTALPGASTWTGRPLACQPCFNAPATGPGSAVSLDPAWSPSGTLLAYVKAPAYRAGGNPSLSWFQAHQLDVWNARTDATRRIGAISGSSLPTWSHTGDRLLYVSDDGLWLANARTGRAVEIEHPLYRETTWNSVGSTSLSFYGQIPWSKQFSWYTP